MKLKTTTYRHSITTKSKIKWKKEEEEKRAPYFTNLISCSSSFHFVRDVYVVYASVVVVILEIA